MTDVPGRFTRIGPEAAREYLLTVAAALQDIARPDGRDDAAAIAAKCSLILVRVAQQIAPFDQALERLLAEAPSLAGEGEVLDALERERASLLDGIRAVEHRHDFDMAGFEAYFRRHPPFANEARLSGAKELKGGRAKRTVLLRFERQGEPAREIVLRQDMPSVFPRTSVTFEYPLLDALWTAGIKVPRPFRLEATAAALGQPFILVGKLPGRTVGDLLSPPSDEGLALQLAEALGEMHGLTARPFNDVPGLATKDCTPDQIRASLAWYRDVYERFDAPNETISAVFRWLEQSVAAVEGPVVLVHGDIGFHNILVEDGRITGLLDWEIAHLGNPAEDIGYCRGDVEMMMKWRRFMDVYHGAGGPAFSDLAVDFHALYGELKVYCSAVMTRMKVASGEIRDLGITECIVDWTPILRQRLSRRLRFILDGSARR